MMTKVIKVTCPVCGEFKFKGIDTQEKCPVCGWVNDQFQAEHKFVGRGANKFSLAQQMKAWRILNGEYEVGYGVDNLFWGAADGCDLCKEKIGIDECYYKVKQLLEGKLPAGVKDLDAARDTCACCLFKKHAEMLDLQKTSKMVEKYSNRDTYGCGHWGVGSDEYDLEYHQRMLKSLIKYVHGEPSYIGDGYNEEPNATYDKVKARLLPMMTADEQGRRNMESYFARPLLSVADFIEYATDENGNLDHRVDLWAFGALGDGEKYEFTAEEKKNADQVLHVTLSFINYKCDSYYDPGLYYLDNRYENWDVNDFDDTIAAWFIDIGDDLDVQFIKDFIKETLKESFACSHIKLALHLMDHLEAAKNDPELQKLAKVFSKVAL